MNAMKIDKTLVKNRFMRSFKDSPYAGLIQPGMAKYLLELLMNNVETRDFPNVLELGCGVHTMAPEVLKHIAVDTWTANDIVPVETEFKESVKDLKLKESLFLNDDMETAELPTMQNLIISSAAIQWTKSPTEFLSRLIHNLAPGGVMALASFGPENFRELRDITGMSLDYLPSSAYPPIFSHDGKLLCIEELKSVMTFDSPLDVLKHLKATGTNSLARQAWTKKDLNHFSKMYRAKFGQDDQVTLTYHPLYCIFQRF
jgi:malonyl-CoA O-methyltransferase